MKRTKLTIEEVKHIAKLANLPIAEKELIKFQEQLSEIVEYVGRLSQADTSKIEPTSQTTRLKNVFREDVVLPSLAQEEALFHAGEKHKGYFKVKAIFKE